MSGKYPKNDFENTGFQSLTECRHGPHFQCGDSPQQSIMNQKRYAVCYLSVCVCYLARCRCTTGRRPASLLSISSSHNSWMYTQIHTQWKDARYKQL